MLYFACSNLSHENLNSAYQEVSAKINDPNKQCEFLATQPLWRTALEKFDSESYVAASDKASDGDGGAAMIRLTEKVMGEVTEKEHKEGKERT